MSYFSVAAARAVRDHYHRDLMVWNHTNGKYLVHSRNSSPRTLSLGSIRGESGYQTILSQAPEQHSKRAFLAAVVSLSICERWRNLGEGWLRHCPSLCCDSGRIQRAIVLPLSTMVSKWPELMLSSEIIKLWIYELWMVMKQKSTVIQLSMKVSPELTQGLATTLCFHRFSLLAI